MPELIDATVLSNFAAVERPDLLRAALGRAEVAAAIYAEVQRGIGDGYAFLRAVESQIFPLKADGWTRFGLMITRARYRSPVTDLRVLLERE